MIGWSNNVSELEAFKYTVRWLKDSDHSKKMITPLRVRRAWIPGFQPNKEVVTKLFRRKKEKPVPYSIFIIDFGNLIHQLIVPSHLDAQSGESINIKIPFFPSRFENNWPMGNLKLETIDLTSHEKVYEKESIHFSYDRLEEIR
jgi:hypothetical protein